MSLNEILCRTLNDPSLFWAALGSCGQALNTLIVVGSVILVFRQLGQIREASINSKIAGLNAAIDILNSDAFRKVTTQSASGGEIRGINWEELLDQINRVAFLVDQKYTDRDLFLNQRGHELAAIHDYLQQYDVGNPSKAEISLRFSPAKQLLDDASTWSKSIHSRWQRTEGIISRIRAHKG